MGSGSQVGGISREEGSEKVLVFKGHSIQFFNIYFLRTCSGHRLFGVLGKKRALRTA